MVVIRFDTLHHMDDSRNELTEPLIKKDPFQESVDISRKGFETAATYFRDLRPEDETRYSHLESVVNNSHVLRLEDDEMTAALQKVGFDIEHAKSIPTIYMSKRGGVLVDAIVTRKGADVKPIIMLHEFVHRSAAQRGLNRQGSPYDEQMYEILDFPKDRRVEMKNTVPEEYGRKLKDTKEAIRIFNEGLTQWATLHLANKTEGFSQPVLDTAYADEVLAVVESFQTSLSTRGLSTEQIEELMLDLALTGDFSRIRTALPVGDDLEQHGFGSDFYVANLVRLVENSYAIKRYDRILGKSK